MTNDLFTVFDEAVELASSVQENFLELGRRMLYLNNHNRNMFKGVCFKTGLDRRKAIYLASIALQVEELAIPDKQLLVLGWTKVEAIGKHLTKTGWKDVLALAKVYSVRELKVIVKGSMPVPGTRCVLLYLMPSQYELFAEVVVKHGGKAKGAGLTGKELALSSFIEKTKAK